MGEFFNADHLRTPKPFFLVFSLERRPPPCHRISKYNGGQEIRTGNPESSDFRSGEVIKLHTRERRTDTGRDRKESQDVAYESRLKGLVSNLKGTDKRLLLCAKITGAWLSICGTTVSGTVLSAT